MRTMLTREQFESLRTDAAQLSLILSGMGDSKELADGGPKAVRATKLAKRIRYLLTEPEEICYRIRGGHATSR